MAGRNPFEAMAKDFAKGGNDKGTPSKGGKNGKKGGFMKAFENAKKKSKKKGKC